MNWWLRDPDKKSGVAVAPSLLSADFARLEAEVREVEKAGAELLHLDVMDGHFVPNLTFGPFVVAAIRKLTELPLDTHLMIERPDRYIDSFIDAGSDVVTVHVEASTDVSRDLSAIRARGKRCGLTLNPDTPFERVAPHLESVDLFLVMSVFPGFGGQSFIPDVLVKVEAARELRERRGLEFAIEIDGGINAGTAAAARRAGAEILVAGTAVFKAPDYPAAIQSLR